LPYEAQQLRLERLLRSRVIVGEPCFVALAQFRRIRHAGELGRCRRAELQRGGNCSGVTGRPGPFAQ